MDSSNKMPQQQESTKEKTLKSNSRSFWFSTGLLFPKLEYQKFQTAALTDLKWRNLARRLRAKIVLFRIQA